MEINERIITFSEENINLISKELLSNIIFIALIINETEINDILPYNLDSSK
jgi:hypothetical protein